MGKKIPANKSKIIQQKTSTLTHEQKIVLNQFTKILKRIGVIEQDTQVEMMNRYEVSDGDGSKWVTADPDKEPFHVTVNHCLDDEHLTIIREICGYDMAFIFPGKNGGMEVYFIHSQFINNRRADWIRECKDWFFKGFGNPRKELSHIPDGHENSDIQEQEFEADTGERKEETSSPVDIKNENLKEVYNIIDNLKGGHDESYVEEIYDIALRIRRDVQTIVANKAAPMVKINFKDIMYKVLPKSLGKVGKDLESYETKFNDAFYMYLRKNHDYFPQWYIEHGYPVEGRKAGRKEGS